MFLFYIICLFQYLIATRLIHPSKHASDAGNSHSSNHSDSSWRRKVSCLPTSALNKRHLFQLPSVRIPSFDKAAVLCTQPEPRRMCYLHLHKELLVIGHLQRSLQPASKLGSADGDAEHPVLRHGMLR